MPRGCVQAVSGAARFPHWWFCGRAALRPIVPPGMKRTQPGTFNFLEIRMDNDNEECTTFDRIVLGIIGCCALWSALYLVYQIVVQ